MKRSDYAKLVKSVLLHRPDCKKRYDELFLILDREGIKIPPTEDSITAGYRIAEQLDKEVKPFPDDMILPLTALLEGMMLLARLGVTRDRM